MQANTQVKNVYNVTALVACTVLIKFMILFLKQSSCIYEPKSELCDLIIAKCTISKIICGRFHNQWTRLHHVKTGLTVEI